MSWIQIHFYTDGEQADFLAELLQAQSALAVSMQDTGDQPIFEPESSETKIWDQTTVTALFAEDIALSEVIANLEVGLGERSLPKHRIEYLADQNWQEETQKNFPPLFFANSLCVCPSWHELPDPSMPTLKLDPGMAFGTGTHETTSLCLQWLAENPPSKKNVLDYGCGSGILGLAALVLNAQSVTAIDICEQALQATKQNAQANQIDSSKLTVFLADEFDSTQQFDVVIANILAKPLQELASRLVALVKSEGRLVLSGILVTQIESIKQAYQPHLSEGAEIEVVENGEWAMLVLTK